MIFKPNIGDVFLNKYEIVSLVGEGAFGSVYRARDTKLERIVAIKFINSTGNTLERFKDELDAIKNLDHPNIVRLYDYDILRGGIPCIVMEFVNGREIGDILAQTGPFTLLRICEIAQQVLDALVETHKNGIVHCDLKPENIMLTSVGARTDVVKLIDFGVASILSKLEDAERAKQLVGTPQYMAPEQIMHGDIGPWTDTYALGLILIELFTGQFVFDHDDAHEVLRMQLHTPVTLPHKLACTELGPIISKATEKDIAKRYRSTQQFYNDICDAMQIMQSSKMAQPMRPRVSTARGRSRAVSSLLEDLADFGIAPVGNRVSLGSGIHDMATQFHMTDMELKNLNPVGRRDSRRSSNILEPLTNDETRLPSAVSLLESVDDNSETIIPIARKNSKNLENSGDFQIPLMTSESLAGVNSPIRKDKDKETTVPVLEPVKPAQGPKEPAAEKLDMTSLQNSLGDMGVPILKAKPESSSESSEKNSDSSLKMPEEIKLAETEIAVKDADLSSEAAESTSSRKVLLIQKKKKSSLPAVIVVCFILLLLVGGGSYAWKTGLLDELLQTIGVETSKSSEPVVEPVEQPVEKKIVVRYSTIQDVSKKMAYCAAISGHLGASKSVYQVKTYRIIGTPITASVYVNGSLLCLKTPCHIHIFGEPGKSKVELRKGNQSSFADLTKHDPKQPLMMNLSN